MTRLKENDVSTIEDSLAEHDAQLLELTGCNLFEIACHALTRSTIKITPPPDFKIIVIPITSGLGRITGFSEAVVSILNFLGFQAEISIKADLSGLYAAYAAEADGIFLADDNDYIAINLHSKKVVHNNPATGYGFAAALDLLLRDTATKNILIMGCGKVGTAAAERLLHSGYSLCLYDKENSIACKMQEKLSAAFPNAELWVTNDLQSEDSHYSAILEATPSATSLNQISFTNVKAVAAAGVPTSIPMDATHSKAPFIHDKLEIGTAVMALSLLLP